MTKRKYRVEIMENGEWQKISSHNNEIWARHNADVLHTSRQCAVRVMKMGKVVYPKEVA
ncbi:MAG: hypothetical protein WC484_06520 [Candidatus Omnitrophota bacterium]